MHGAPLSKHIKHVYANNCIHVHVRRVCILTIYSDFTYHKNWSNYFGLIAVISLHNGDVSTGANACVVLVVCCIC